SPHDDRPHALHRLRVGMLLGGEPTIDLRIGLHILTKLGPGIRSVWHQPGPSTANETPVSHQPVSAVPLEATATPKASVPPPLDGSGEQAACAFVLGDVVRAV